MAREISITPLATTLREQHLRWAKARAHSRSSQTEIDEFEHFRPCTIQGLTVRQKGGVEIHHLPPDCPS